MVTPLQLLKQIEETRLKHLAGRHDQRSHGRSKGAKANEAILRQAEEDFNKYGVTGTIGNEETAKYFANLGYSQETLQESNRILDGHGYGDESEKLADARIIQEMRGESELGRLFKDRIRLEDRLHGIYIKSLDTKLKKEREQFEDDWAWYFSRSGNKGVEVRGIWYTTEYGDTEEQAKEKAWQGVRWDFEDWNEMAYRKGNLDKPIQSWSTHPKGASTQPGYRMGWDHKIRLDELKKNGYHVLGRYTHLMGAPGEAEITLIKLPEDIKL